MPPDDAETDRRCNRCGGEAVPKSGDGVDVLECADCGNVLGLARPEADEGDTEALTTGTVHATDGNLDQLHRLLRTRGGEEPRLEADRLILEIEAATIAVTPDGDTLAIRSVDEE